MTVFKPGLPLAIAAAAALPVALFSPKAMAPLFVLVVVAMAVAHVLAERACPPLPPRFSAALAAFTALSAASAAWSLTPGQTLAAVGPFMGLLVGIALLFGLSPRLSEIERQSVRTGMLFSMGVGLVLMLIEGTLTRPLLRLGLALVGTELDPGLLLPSLKPGSTVAALSMWPFLVVLGQRFSRTVVAIACAILFVIVAVAGSITAAIAIFLGIAAFLLARRAARATAVLLAGAVVIGALAAPWLPPLLPDPATESRHLPFLSNSAWHRVYIWKDVSALIREKPLLGYGFDASRTFGSNSGKQHYVFRKDDPARAFEHNAERIPLHPHNLALQIWLETGAAGVALIAAALLVALAALARAPLERTERAAGYGFFVTTLVIASGSYGAWQAWWISAMGLSAAFLVAVFSRSPPRMS